MPIGTFAPFLMSSGGSDRATLVKGWVAVIGTCATVAVLAPGQVRNDLVLAAVVLVAVGNLTWITVRTVPHDPQKLAKSGAAARAQHEESWQQLHLLTQLLAREHAWQAGREDASSIGEEAHEPSDDAGLEPTLLRK
jgi:hypothetical protein